MDKQLHTPEEEAYLRMLDREVPDLWSRIEAGLDRAEKEGSQNREARFLAGQETGQIVSIEQGRAKRKGSRTGLIIGIVAAAVVLIASLAIIGFAGREKKSDSAPDSGSLNMDISGLKENEETDRKEQKGEYSADEPDALMGGSAPAMDNAALDEGQKGKNAQWSYRADSKPSEVEAVEDAAEAGEDVGAAQSQSAKIVTVISEVRTLGQLMAYENQMSEKDKADVADGKFRIIYEKDGVSQTYVIFGTDSDGLILLLEEGIYLSDGTDEDKKTQVIGFSPDQKIGMRMTGGRMEFTISQ